MNATLPIELRDMVLGLLWTQSDVDAFSDLDSFIYHRCSGSHCHCLQYLQLPYILDPSYVGSQTAIEASASLFRKLPWTMSLNRADDIKRVLYGDIFHNGFRPVNSAHTLAVKFSLDRCARKEQPAPAPLRIEKSVFSWLAQLQEPERATHWLQACFEHGDNAELPPRVIWREYTRSFDEGHLSTKELMQLIPTVIPGADYSQTQHTVVGLRRRTVPVIPASSWIDKTLGENLLSLLDISTKGDFKLRITMLQQKIDLNMLERVLRIIAPVFFAFRASGAVVKITFRHDYDRVHYTNGTGWASSRTSFVWNLDDAFLSPPDVWKQKLKDGLDTVSSSDLHTQSTHARSS
jgi:hypothetical protein